MWCSTSQWYIIWDIIFKIISFYEAQFFFQESLFIPFPMNISYTAVYFTWRKICLQQLRLNYNPYPLPQQQTHTEGINIFYLF